MSFTETLKERQGLSFVTTTTINAGSTASVSTPALNMAYFRRVRAFLVLGTLTSTASVNISLQASASSGSGFSNITVLTTNPTVTAITTDDSLNCLEIRADQLPAGTQYIRATATETASQNAVVTIVMVGDESAYKPGNQFNASTPTNDVVAYLNAA